MRDAIWYGIILSIFAIVAGGVVWSITPQWAEVGHVTWVGQKSYNTNGWDIPYTVTTVNHGALNFTTSKVPITDRGLANMPNISPSVGLLVGVKLFNSGEYQVENDP